MKQTYLKAAIVFLLTILIWGGCIVEIETPTSLQAENTVLFRLAGGDVGGERTLLPTAPTFFSRYSLSFNGLSGQPSVNEIFDVSPRDLAGDGKGVMLAPGNWVVTLTAHTAIRDIPGLLDADYPVARGRVTFSVVAGQTNTPVTINIEPITNEGSGALRYRAETAARFRVLTVEGAELDPPVSFERSAGASGTLTLPAGFYILQADSGSMVTTSVLHIYGGMITNMILTSGFRFTQQSGSPQGDDHLVLRYKVNPEGTAFTATPAIGASWNAALHGGAHITTVDGRRVVHMGNNNDGWVDLGAQVGVLLQSLPEFTIETYVHIDFWNMLRDNDVESEGHFLWTFSNIERATAADGAYMSLRAANRIFAVSDGGRNAQQPVFHRFNNSNNPLRRGVWEHVVLTRLGNTFRLYIDGRLENEVTTTVAHNGFGAMNYNFLSRPVVLALTPGGPQSPAGQYPPCVPTPAYLDRSMFYRLSIYNRAFSLEEINNNLGAREILDGFSHERILPRDPSVPMRPAALHTEEDFIRIRNRLAANHEPWVSGYQQLITNSHVQPDWNGPHPTVSIVRGGAGQNFEHAMRSATAAYQNALIYRIGHESNSRAFGERAVYIMNRWAATTTSITGTTDRSLAAGLYGYMFALAGDLMRDFDGWAPADFAGYQQWMLDVWYPEIMDFLIRHHNCWDDHYWANWAMCNLAALMAIGVLTDRRDLYNWAMEALQGNYGAPHSAFEDQIRVVGNGFWFKAINYVHTLEDGTRIAQQQESGRSSYQPGGGTQSYPLMVLGLMGVIAQMAWNQGDDLFALGGNLLLMSAEYTAKYNIAGLEVPFTRYVRLWQNNTQRPRNAGPARNIMTEIAWGNRGANRPVWALIYYHYAVEKGVASRDIRWTRMAKEVSSPEEGPQMGQTSGAYDQPGLGTLMFSR
ncbi:MAG: alginate lyase family protein [Treponema sp.]|nr:alginate lyase family protein [Treponema sp.]